MAEKKTAAAETEQEEAVATETEQVATETAPAVEGEAQGIRARRAFMLKQFVPNPDWINVNIVAKGKGTRVKLARIFGFATGTSRKTNTLPDGSTSESIFVSGMFQSENYLDGELGEASGVYFPMAYAEKIETIFKMDETIKVAEIDCDVGLEATGKTIPYEWVITAYVEGAEMAVLKNLRNRRARPSDAPALQAPAKQAALAAPIEGAATA